MGKLSLDRVNSSFGFQTAFNNVLARIEEEFSDKVLYRDNPIGEVNNMHNDLDMSGHDVLNIGTVSAKDFRVDGQDINEAVNSLVAKIDVALDEAEAFADEAEASANEAEGWANQAAINAATVAYNKHEGILLEGGSVITLPWTYNTGIGVEVFLYGVKQAQSTLIFTNPTTVTLSTPVSEDTAYEVVSTSRASNSFSDQLAGVGGSSLVGFTQTGAGATHRTVQAKLRDTISVKDFGAVGDGVADDTAAIQNFLTVGGGFIPPGTYRITSTIQIPSNSRMVGVGFSFQQYSTNPIAVNAASRILYDGPAGLHTCVINASRADVGVRPGNVVGELQTLKNVEISGMVIDGNGKADIGFYTARSGLGNKFNAIYVTGTLKRGFFFGQFWTARAENLFAVFNFGTGFSIGENYFGWSDNIVNACLFENLLAFKNGRDQTYDYETNGFSGVGYVINTNKSCTFNNVVAEMNWGAGIVVGGVDGQRGGPLLMSGLYLEDNCHYNVSTDGASLVDTALALGRCSYAWGLVYRNRSGGTFSGPTFIHNVFGANIDGTRPTGIKLTGNTSGGFVFEPLKPVVFDGVIVIDNIDSDFHNFEVYNSNLTGEVTTEPDYSKLLPYSGKSESINCGVTTLWVSNTKSGNASGRNSSNYMLLEDAVKVARVCKDVSIINVSGYTGTSSPSIALQLDGDGITRGITISGDTTGRFNYSSATSNIAAYLKNWKNLSVTGMSVLDRLVIQNSSVVFDNCPIIRTGSNNTPLPAVITEDSFVSFIGTSRIDVANSTAATKICLSVSNGSEISFDNPDGLTLRNFTPGNSIHFNIGSGLIRVGTTSVIATWAASGNITRNTGGNAGFVFCTNGINPV